MPTTTTSAAFKPVPGTGLPAVIYTAIVLFSVTLFLTYGGLLWDAPREASHVGRFVVSYVAVVPVAALLLVSLRRFSWSRLVTTTGTAWAIKLVVTSMLYVALARGSATRLEAAPAVVPSRHAVSAGSADYQAASGAFASGTLSGRVLAGGVAAPGAVVFLDEPGDGAELAGGADVTLHIADGRYEHATYLARTTDRVLVLNTDSALHTVHLRRDDRTVANEPVPASSTPHALRVQERGVYEIRCDNHPDERAVLVVVDHPYAALTGPRGEFSLSGVPAGNATLAVVAGASQASRRIRITPQERTEATLDLATDEPAPTIR